MVCWITLRLDIKEKLELIKQSEYIHDFLKVIKYKNKKGKIKRKYVGLNPSKAGSLMHLYIVPEIIIVNELE